MDSQQYFDRANEVSRNKEITLVQIHQSRLSHN